MARRRRHLPQGHSFHITLRCTSRAFPISNAMRRYVPLAALEKAMQKYPFHLYGICLKANHIHLLLKPADATQLPERCISSPNMPQCCSTASAGVAGTFFWGGVLRHTHCLRKLPKSTQHAGLHPSQSKSRRSAKRFKCPMT
jgi:hypothetical protein